MPSTEKNERPSPQNPFDFSKPPKVPAGLPDECRSFCEIEAAFTFANLKTPDELYAALRDYCTKDVPAKTPLSDIQIRLNFVLVQMFIYYAVKLINAQENGDPCKKEWKEKFLKYVRGLFRADPVIAENAVRAIEAELAREDIPYAEPVSLEDTIKETREPIEEVLLVAEPAIAPAETVAETPPDVKIPQTDAELEAMLKEWYDEISRVVEGKSLPCFELLRKKIDFVLGKLSVELKNNLNLSKFTGYYGQVCFASPFKLKKSMPVDRKKIEKSLNNSKNQSSILTMLDVMDKAESFAATLEILGQHFPYIPLEQLKRHQGVLTSGQYFELCILEILEDRKKFFGIQ